MFGIGGFNPISLLATSAFGPLGGIAAQYFTQIFSSMGQQIIQTMGERLDLPQSQIDFAQTAFAASRGDFIGTAQNMEESIASYGREIGASPQDIGRAQREAQDGLMNLLNDLAQSDEVRDIRNGRSSGQGWLRAMAEVLGRKLDDLAHEMEDLANRVTKDDPSTSTDFTVVSQQFNMLMSTVSTALKTIGEALGKMASRQ